MTLSILIPSATEPNILKMITETEKLFPEAQIIIANDRYRKGKGWAIREALSQATGENIVFIDGDMDIHPRVIRRMLPLLKSYDIVVGKKETKAMLSRHILTILSRIYIWFVFRIPVDTQTGVKAFKRRAIPSWETDSFAFDIEILSKAKNNGCSMVEVPVRAERTKRMAARSILHTLLESFKVWRRVR